MKLFLDTADLQSISKWADSGLIDGVTTNPSHLSAVGGDPKQTVLSICKLLPNGEISVEVTEEKPDMVYAQAKKIAALAPNVVVKIPCHRAYYPVITKLVHEGVPLNITLVFTLVQGMFMAKLGARYISPFVGRWDDNDADGTAVLYELREMLDTYNYETQILAASLRHVRHVHEAIRAGADVATMPAAVLEKAAAHVLTDQGMALFAADWKKIQKGDVWL